MSPTELVDQVVNAVLYEGYLLYPYRTSSVKNQVRWTFGGVYPRVFSEENGGSDAWRMQTECLLRPEPGCTVDVEVRFLHLLETTTAGGRPRQEATERRVGATGLDVSALEGHQVTVPISFAASTEESDGVAREAEEIEAVAEVGVEPVADGALRLRVAIHNHTPVAPGLSREDALRRSLVSANTLLRLHGGAFVSQTDVPSDLADAAAQCRNVGTWPVLVGEPGSLDTMLSSPIILEDHPRVAPESPGDLFDSTEIDEILSLRILALSDEEKAEVRQGDDRGRALLERTESLTADELMKMHGAVRGLRPAEEG